MTLYEIDNEISNLFVLAQEAFEKKEDEHFEWLEQEFKRLKITKEKKITNTIKYIKNLECLNDGIKKEKESFDKRMKSNENKIKSSKLYLGKIIGFGNKYEDVNNKISWRKSESVEIINFEQLEDAYINHKQTWTPDKNAIKEDLKKGIKVKGAVLKEKNNIQIK
jgi:hypothetical protein